MDFYSVGSERMKREDKMNKLAKKSGFSVIPQGFDPRIKPNPGSVLGQMVENPVFEEKIVHLNPKDVHFSNVNPRLFQDRDDQFLKFKESIGSGGITSPIKIFKKDANSAWEVAAGGNRRLRALQELAEEDSRFEIFAFVSVPYQGEEKAYWAHFAENEFRQDLTYWEKVCSMMNHKKRVEKDFKELKRDQFLAILKENGLSLSAGQYQYRVWAYETLNLLDDEVKKRLTGMDVKRIQPKLNSLIEFFKLWDAGTLCESVLKSTFETFANEYQLEKKRFGIKKDEEGNLIEPKINFMNLVNQFKDRVRHAIKMQNDPILFDKVLTLHLENKKLKSNELLALAQAAIASEEKNKHTNSGMKNAIKTLDEFKQKIKSVASTGVDINITLSREVIKDIENLLKESAQTKQDGDKTE